MITVQCGSSLGVAILKNCQKSKKSTKSYQYFLQNRTYELCRASGATEATISQRTYLLILGDVLRP